MPAPRVHARGAFRHVYGSRLAALPGAFGAVFLALGIALGPVGALIGVPSLVVLVWQMRRLSRLRLVVDAPGPGARLHLGPHGRESVALAEVAGGIVQHIPGATRYGIRIGADIERWLVMGFDGRIVAHVDGRGFARADLDAVRGALGGTWMALPEAMARGLVPADAPWDVRNPRVAIAIAFAVAIAAVAAVIAGFLLIGHIGTAALVWPWW